MRSIAHMTDAARSGIMPPAQLTTINQSQLSAQLGLNLGGASMPHTSPSPPASKSATPSPSSSINEEDADESNRVSELPQYGTYRRIGDHPMLMALNFVHGITFFFVMDLEEHFNLGQLNFFSSLLFIFCGRYIQLEIGRFGFSY